MKLARLVVHIIYLYKMVSSILMTILCTLLGNDDFEFDAYCCCFSHCLTFGVRGGGCQLLYVTVIHVTLYWWYLLKIQLEVEKKSPDNSCHVMNHFWYVFGLFFWNPKWYVAMLILSFVMSYTTCAKL